MKNTFKSIILKVQKLGMGRYQNCLNSQAAMQNH